MLKENNSQVGGFGYGMKDMFREILHREILSRTECGEMTRSTRSERRRSLPPFAALPRRQTLGDPHQLQNKEKTVKERNVLEIEVKLPGIVSKFKEEVFKCCALFWDTFREEWISAAMSVSDGSWVCLARTSSLIPTYQKWSDLKCCRHLSKVSQLGLFVTQNDLRLKQDSLVFGGSKARPQTSGSHLNRGVILKELGRMSPPGLDEERDRAKDCLSYLISESRRSGFKASGPSRLGGGKTPSNERPLPPPRLRPEDSLRLQTGRASQRVGAKMANVLAIHTKPQYFEKYMNPAFQCLENPSLPTLSSFLR